VDAASFHHTPSRRLEGRVDVLGASFGFVHFFFPAFFTGMGSDRFPGGR
jgi:hypothetical protein